MRWVHARIHWGEPLDAVIQDLSKPAGATHLVTWPATEFDTTETDCFSVGDQIWIWQPEVGAVRFLLNEARLDAFRWPDSDPARFRQIVTRAWLPAIYPLWGRQVLHASAIACPATGESVAFTGSTHAGKSTTAYGVARRGAWRLVCDDTLGFSVEDGTIPLYPLPNQTRLRPASADYYGVTGQAPETLNWPDLSVQLKTVYVLDGDEDHPAGAEFTRLRAAEALPLLLRQAYALSFELPKYNQQLMRDYLALAAGVPVYRLRYRRSFDEAEALFASIESHLASMGVACI